MIRIKDVIGDGNCPFHAFLHSYTRSYDVISTCDKVKKADNLRKYVIYQIPRMIESPFFTRGMLDVEAERLKIRSYYPQDPTMYALSSIYNVGIVVISHIGMNIHTQTISSSDTIDKWIFLINRRSPDHYYSLEYNGYYIFRNKDIDTVKNALFGSKIRLF